jgi:hypothetical protein
VEFGPARYRVLAISYALLAEDSAKLEALAKLQADRNILCYRDGRGEKVYCNFDEEMQTGYMYPTGWKETIGLVETDYVEVVTGSQARPGVTIYPIWVRMAASGTLTVTAEI